MMNDQSAYRDAARAYADGVRVLFAAAGLAAGERGGHGPASADDLAVQAENLAPLASQLTAAAAARLEEPDAGIRAQATTQLLAKALSDLEVSSHLYGAAIDQADGVPWTGGQTDERSLRGVGAREENLRLLLGGAGAGTQVVGGSAAPLPPAAAQRALNEAVEDALDLISKRATDTGKQALGGLLGLGAGELAAAAGATVADLAQALGVAEVAGRLVQLFRTFALNAYESVAALFGPTALQQAGAAALEWLDELKEGKFGDIVESIYRTADSRQALTARVAAADVEPSALRAAVRDVDALAARFGRQADLVDKLLRSLKYLGGVAATALPQGTLLVAAANLTLGAWIVLAGADYADAPPPRILNRIEGVRTVVTSRLQT